MDSDTPQNAPAGGDRICRAFEAHEAELRRYARVRLRDESAAEEVVQESFFRLVREAEAGRFPAQPRAWLFRVTLNLIVSGARRAAVARSHATRAPLTETRVESPEMQFLVSEQRENLTAALAATGRSGRTGLILASRGYSGREIASMLGRSEAATRTLLHRARKTVRHELTSIEATQVAV